MAPKTSLSIQLIEPVVYLQRLPDDCGTLRAELVDPMTAVHVDADGVPAVRGILTLNLGAPTRISCITLNLQCRASTIWPGGSASSNGKGRENVEQHTLYSASYDVYRSDVDPAVLDAQVGPSTVRIDTSPSTTDSDTDPSPRRHSMFQNRVASMVNLHRTLSALPEYPGEPSSLKSRASSLVKLRRMFAGSEQDGTTVSPPGKLEYPIFFELPRDLPPSHHSLASFIIWRLTAHVKRKGALASDLVSGAVVTVVGSEGAPPNIPISLHGHWNDALHYSIISSSSVVSLGAEWPVEITLRPISKVKIREITAELQERVVYYTKGRVVLHKLAPVGHTLLTIRRTGLPILPVMSDDIKAFRTSSLFPYVETEEPQTSSLLGPGPWTLRCNLDMSHKVKHLHRTHTNAMSNVSVTHVLRIVIKVQEGGSTADIVKEAPVHILSSCYTNAWNQLPSYLPPSSAASSPETRRSAPQASQASHPSPFGSETSALSQEEACALLERRKQYERIFAGRVNPCGECPPAYCPTDEGTLPRTSS